MSEKNLEQSPLDIINDPNNFVSTKEAFKEEIPPIAHETKKVCGISRRNMLKLGGGLAAASVVASAVTGFKTGRSGDAYTGYGRTAEGEDMFFNREPFRTDVAPAMSDVVGEVRRAEWWEYFDGKHGFIGQIIADKTWNPSMGVDAIPGPVGDHYRANPHDYEYLVKSLENAVKGREYWNKTGHKQFAIAGAYTAGYMFAFANRNGSTIPEDPGDVYKQTGIEQPPEEWDFRHVSPNKMEFKSPAHASKLIKRVAHLYGASVVGICKFDPTFLMKDTMRGMKDGGRGYGDKVPEHWKSMIVFGAPMYWDSTYSAIGYSTSFDGYFRARIMAGLMENFIQALGYPARAECPPYNYEIMMTPYTILAGLAEYGRSGLAMIPEFGCNFRPSGVITSIEFEYDKPIDLGMAKFCKKCKICAETCPSGSISFDDEPQTVVRGYRRWKLDDESCFNQWVSGTTIDGLGCRVCVAVCPYTRKNTWIHKISRELEARDPTGLVATGLLAMQENFFKYPAGEEFRAPWQGGREAVYHDPPWWERSEDFFKDVIKTWTYDGMH